MSRVVEQKLERNIAVDAYRGLVMVLMMAEVLELAYVHKTYFPDSLVLEYSRRQPVPLRVGRHEPARYHPAGIHISGRRCASLFGEKPIEERRDVFAFAGPHHLAQPHSYCAGHLPSSTQGPMTNFAFTDTLSQIGLGYTFAFLLTFVRPRWQWTAFGAILFGYWLAWALYPAPGPALTMRRWEFPRPGESFQLHRFYVALEQEQQPWTVRSIVWFLNLFPRSSRFLFAGAAIRC